MPNHPSDEPAMASVSTIRRIYAKRHEIAKKQNQPSAFQDSLEQVVKEADRLILAIEMTTTYFPGKKPERTENNG